MKKTTKVLLAALAIVAGAVLPCLGVSYTYDSIGRLTRAVYNSGLQISYVYDKVGNIERISKDYADFEITFEANGGSEVEPITAKPGEDIYAPAEPERLGYIFLGWFTDEDCTQKYNFEKMPAKNLTLYAGWEFDENYNWYFYGQSFEFLEIHTEGELKTIEKIVASGDDFYGRTIFLQADIGLTSEWVPIGNEECKFNGTFHGNGHTIAQITVNSAEKDFAGFFGATGENSSVKLLKLADVNINGADNVGAIAGTSGGLIINCVVSGSVHGNTNVGGLVGVNNGDVVNIQANVDVNGSDFVGKAVGLNNGTAMLCVLAGSICDFTTDNFGMFTGYSSEAGHENYSVYLIEETSQKTMQAYGLNSIYDETERSRLAYYFYYEEFDEYPDLRSAYIAQLDHVYHKMNKSCETFGAKYKGNDLILWNEEALNDENIPCTLNF